MESTSNVNANVNADESEDEKRAGLVRMEALNARIKTYAESHNMKVTRVREIAFLNMEARANKANVNEWIAAFDNEYPLAVRGEWNEKLAELDAAVNEANKTKNATLIKFAMETREREIKRHEAQIKNAEKAAKSRKDRKASEVTTKLVSFDEYGMPLAI